MTDHLLDHFNLAVERAKHHGTSVTLDFRDWASVVREVGVLRAARADTPALDVERLAEAIWTAETGDYLQYADPVGARKFAAAIAREYTALSPTHTPKEPA